MLSARTASAVAISVCCCVSAAMSTASTAAPQQLPPHRTAGSASSSASADVAGLVLYVWAQHGNDSWDGLAPQLSSRNSARGPVASIHRALELLLLHDSEQQQRRVIFVREGMYRITAPLVLGPLHSNVTVSGYPGDMLPVISGAQVLGPWQRRQWWQGRRSGGGGATIAWVSQWPGGANFSRVYTAATGRTAGLRRAAQLLPVGRAMDCSRAPPNPQAFFHWTSPLVNCTAVPHSRPDCPDIDKRGFVYSPRDLPDQLLRAQPTRSLRVRVQSAPFEARIHRVSQINRSSHQLLFVEPDAFALGHYGNSDPNRTRYAMYNVRPFVADTWSWTGGQLHLRLPATDDPNEMEVLAPALSSLLRVQSGARGVVLKGLKFVHSGNGGAETDHRLAKLVAAVQILGSTNVTMEVSQFGPIWPNSTDRNDPLN
jgi:hypothetical protein